LVLGIKDIRKPGALVFWWGNLRERDHLEDLHKWEDNIKMDLQEVVCEVMGWIDLAQDRGRWQSLVNAIVNLQIPSNAGNFLTS